MRSAMLLASSLALAGCAATPPTPEPAVRVVEVPVPVPTACLAVPPARPDVRAPADIARMPAGPGVVELGAAYALLWDYAARWEAVAAPCVASDATAGGADGSRGGT